MKHSSLIAMRKILPKPFAPTLVTEEEKPDIGKRQAKQIRELADKFTKGESIDNWGKGVITAALNFLAEHLEDIKPTVKPGKPQEYCHDTLVSEYLYLRRHNFKKQEVKEYLAELHDVTFESIRSALQKKREQIKDTAHFLGYSKLE